MPAKKKTYKLPTYLAPREKNNKHKYKYIPKKIFQTGETNEVTKGMYDAVHTWIDKNPDWEYHFFDNKACRYFIKEHFPKKVLDAYDTLIPGAYKADLWRYCVLYIHGGVYVDNKCVLLASSLNDVIPEDVEFLSVLAGKQKERCYEYPGYIFQAFICSKPKHLFLKKAIDMIIKNVDIGYYGPDSLSPTGPALLGKAMNLVMKRNEKSSHHLGFSIFSGFKYFLWEECLDNNIKTSYKNKDECNVFKHKYSVKDYDLQRKNNTIKNMQSNYWVSWAFEKVYKHGKVDKNSLIVNNHKCFSAIKWLRFLLHRRELKKFLQLFFWILFKRPKMLCYITKKIFRK